MDAKLIAPVWVARVTKDEYMGDDHRANTAVAGFGNSGLLGEMLGLRRFSHGAVTVAISKLPSKWGDLNRSFVAAIDDKDAAKAAAVIDKFAADLTEGEYADAGGNAHAVAAAWDGV